jgi:serine/threonine-protein kinase RsbW
MSRAETTTIRNRREEVARVAEAVDRLATEHHVDAEVVADLQVALDEVLSNIVDHGYADDAEHEIRVELRVAGGALEAIVEDDGVPFNPLQSAPPDTRSPLAERGIGGLGLHFVRNLMSEVSYARVDGRNRLVLRKKLNN